MKKFGKWMCAALLAVATGAGAAEMDYGVWTDSPEIASASVNGVRWGLPLAVSSGKVDGAELSILYSGTREVTGIKYSLLGGNNGGKLEGVSVGLFNNSGATVDSIQLGLVNNSGKGGIQLGLVNNNDDDALFQLGLVNFNKNGWLPVMLFFNIGSQAFE